MEIILLSVCLIFLIFISLSLFFIGGYMVSMKERHDKMFLELIEIISAAPTTVPPVDSENKLQTWDEKYEAELERISRAMRAQSGLADLPSVQSYDTPRTS